MSSSIESIVSELSALTPVKRLWKTSEFPLNNPLRVIKFKQCTTRYGDAITIELEEANYILPRRYLKVLTSEKLELLNSPARIVHITLTGFQNCTQTITSPVFTFTQAMVNDNA